MKRYLFLLLVPALVALGACGSDDGSTNAGAGKGADRTIDVEMRDIAYSPTTVDVRVGALTPEDADVLGALALADQVREDADRAALAVG